MTQQDPYTMGVGGFGGEELIATRDTHVTEEERARGFSGGSRETKGAKKSGLNRVNGTW